eukprot:g18903.t1
MSRYVPLLENSKQRDVARRLPPLASSLEVTCTSSLAFLNAVSLNHVFALFLHAGAASGFAVTSYEMGAFLAVISDRATTTSTNPEKTKRTVYSFFDFYEVVVKEVLRKQPFLVPGLQYYFKNAASEPFYSSIDLSAALLFMKRETMAHRQRKAAIASETQRQPFTNDNFGAEFEEELRILNSTSTPISELADDVCWRPSDFYPSFLEEEFGAFESLCQAVSEFEGTGILRSDYTVAEVAAFLYNCVYLRYGGTTSSPAGALLGKLVFDVLFDLFLPLAELLRTASLSSSLGVEAATATPGPSLQVWSQRLQCYLSFPELLETLPVRQMLTTGINARLRQQDHTAALSVHALCEQLGLRSKATLGKNVGVSILQSSSRFREGQRERDSDVLVLATRFRMTTGSSSHASESTSSSVLAQLRFSRSENLAYLKLIFPDRTRKTPSSARGNFRMELLRDLEFSLLTSSTAGGGSYSGTATLMIVSRTETVALHAPHAVAEHWLATVRNMGEAPDQVQRGAGVTTDDSIQNWLVELQEKARRCGVSKPFFAGSGVVVDMQRRKIIGEEAEHLQASRGSQDICSFFAKLIEKTPIPLLGIDEDVKFDLDSDINWDAYYRKHFYTLQKKCFDAAARSGGTAAARSGGTVFGESNFQHDVDFLHITKKFAEAANLAANELVEEVYNLAPKNYSQTQTQSQTKERDDERKIFHRVTSSLAFFDDDWCFVGRGLQLIAVRGDAKTGVSELDARKKYAHELKNMEVLNQAIGQVAAVGGGGVSTGMHIFPTLLANVYTNAQVLVVVRPRIELPDIVVCEKIAHTTSGPRGTTSEPSAASKSTSTAPASIVGEIRAIEGLIGCAKGSLVEGPHSAIADLHELHELRRREEEELRLNQSPNARGRNLSGGGRAAAAAAQQNATLRKKRKRLPCLIRTSRDDVWQFHGMAELFPKEPRGPEGPGLVSERLRPEAVMGATRAGSRSLAGIVRTKYLASAAELLDKAPIDVCCSYSLTKFLHFNGINNRLIGQLCSVCKQHHSKVLLAVEAVGSRDRPAAEWAASIS